MEPILPTPHQPLRIKPRQTFWGTPDEVLTHWGEIPPDATVELNVFESTPDDEDVSAFAGKSLAEMIEDIGTVEGLPTDLASNPDHMKGFGGLQNRRTLQL